MRLPGVQRWVDQHGLISLAGFGYRVPTCWPGSRSRRSPLSIWCGSSTVGCWSPSTSQRRKPDTGDREPVRLRQGSRRPRRRHRRADRDPDGRLLGLCVVRRHQLSGRERAGAAAASQVCDRGRLGAAVLRRPDRAGAPDPARPGQGAWRVRHPERAAPPPTGCAGRGRRQGHAAARSAYRPSLDPDPSHRRYWQRRGTTRPTQTMLIMSSRYRNSFVKRVPELDMSRSELCN